MGKVLLRGVMVLVISGFLFGCARNLKEFAYLQEPQMRTMPKQKMLVAEVHGDPGIVSSEAFSVLYKTIYQLKREVKGLKISPPRGRFPKPFDTPRNEWVNIYGLPIPESAASLPAQKKPSLPEVKIEYWEYGEVAEILHIGPYSAETPTIKKLCQFIKANGYEIVEVHEEEYLKGPGMFFKGNPAKYQTIIRYRIQK